ncbi:MAG: hypothetical protein J6K32_08745 [Clostridia bacterium]|nr:hypothetical protein [Clostridia bacterium]
MGFFDRMRASLARFMSGRYGADQLSQAMVIAAIVLTVLGILTGIGLLGLVSNVLLLLAVFRMLSKDRYRRAHENQVYLEKTFGLRKDMTERMNRFKNRKKFCYFSCPKCRTKLRVPRGVGNVTITCKSCGNKFDKKA